MTRAVRHTTALAVLVALLSGCAVGPDFRRPAAPTVDRYARPSLGDRTVAADVPGGDAQRVVPGQDVPYDWWRLFRSPALDSLVQRALRASPTLTAARQSVRQALALVYAQRGGFFPTVDASLSANRTKTSSTIAPPTVLPSDTLTLYSLQGTLTFPLDVFGGNRRQVEALLGQAEAQRFQLEAAYVLLTTTVVTAAVQEASLRAQLAATREIIAISTRSLELVRRQFALGAVAGIDVAAQEAALAQVAQTLPPLQKQLEQTRNVLAALLGRLPVDDPDETFELVSFELPTELPVGIPSRLVEQRPDVRAAEAQLHAASAQIGVAVASRLPQLTITAAYGGTSTRLTELFANGNPFWTIAGNVAHTIFDAGTLFFRQRAAEAAFEQAAAQYRGTVIAGYQTVADALYALQADAESLRAAAAAERATRRTLDITLKQQELGAVSYLALLSARQAYQQALITGIQARASRLTDTATLFQALGGGSANRPPVTAAQREDSR